MAKDTELLEKIRRLNERDKRLGDLVAAFITGVDAALEIENKEAQPAEVN